MEHNEFSERRSLVLSGGGANGLMHVGVIHHIEIKNNVQNIKDIYDKYLGCSVGSIICLCVVCGLSSVEIIRLYQKHSIISHDMLRLRRVLQNITLEILSNVTENANISMYELFNISQKHLSVSVCDLCEIKETIIDHKSHPNALVHQVIRATMAIPVIFDPIIIGHKLYCDGALINNFPLVKSDLINNPCSLGSWICNHPIKLDVNDLIVDRVFYLRRLIECVYHSKEYVLRQTLDKKKINNVVLMKGVYDTISGRGNALKNISVFPGFVILCGFVYAIKSFSHQKTVVSMNKEFVIACLSNLVRIKLFLFTYFMQELISEFYRSDIKEVHNKT
jgi:hypothetical protein